MLLPRPEIRTATRFGSRIVRRGPVLGRVPAARPAAHGAAALPFFDAADFEHLLARAFEQGAHCGHFAFRDDRDHADAAVEGPRHFPGGNPAALLKEAEDR